MEAQLPDTLWHRERTNIRQRQRRLKHLVHPRMRLEMHKRNNEARVLRNIVPNNV